MSQRRSLSRSRACFVVSLLLLACGVKFSFAQEFETRQFENREARHAGHARHAGAGQAGAHAQRHVTAGHGHHHHHTNTTSAITTNTTPSTTTTIPTTTPKSPAPASSSADPYWDLNGTTAGSGGPTPSGTWSTGVANWNSSSAGTSATAVWSNGANAATF